MKALIIAISAVVLTGCGKFNDAITTTMDGYVVKCIDGTKYVMMTSEHGVAVTPHVGVDGKPKSCTDKPN